MAESLLRAARQFPAVLLTGARQTGKTTLLKHAFPKANLCSLDLPSAAAQAEERPEQMLDDLVGPAIIDEVQYAPALFRHLKHRIDGDRHRMGRFLMTGSQPFALMKSVSESLAGRCAILELDSLSAPEVRGAFGRRGPKPEEFLWRGGFPELWREPDLDANLFFTSYVATYLERDVRSALRVGNLRDFERFVRLCAARSGQLVNRAEMGATLGVAATTAWDWLSVLEASGQIVFVQPFFGNFSRRLIKTPKLFFRDTGLLCFLLGLSSPAALVQSSFIGPVWETFILNELLRARAARSSPAEIYFWRDAHNTEVDFVLNMDGRIRLVEAKWSENPVAGRMVQPLLKVDEELGRQAASEHLIACRTKHEHVHPAHANVRVVDGYTFTEWLRS
jgi:uncharacterized protein